MIQGSFFYCKQLTEKYFTLSILFLPYLYAFVLRGDEYDYFSRLFPIYRGGYNSALYLQVVG